MTKKIRIVTHNAGFHADDVFGVATLMLLLGKDNVEVIRSRDQAIIDSGDYVLDVGNIYDPEFNKFDHHQAGGAGLRENGIPYASFGLIWRKFGAQVAGSQEVADSIEKGLVQSIDANDNGVTLYDLKHPSKIRPFSLGRVVASFAPAREEAKTHDEGFAEATAFARQLLIREILHAKSDAGSRKIIAQAYESASDKRLVIIEADPPISRTMVANVLCEYPEPLYFVRQHENGSWQAVCVNEPDDSFAHRKPLPVNWAGKRDAELVAATGVHDAIFCHNNRFMIVTTSKESAIKLAELALVANS